MEKKIELKQKSLIYIIILFLILPIALAGTSENIPVNLGMLNIAPTSGNLKESPTDPATYETNKVYKFNVTVNDQNSAIDINTVLFSWNDTANKTVTTYRNINSTAREYEHEITDLAVASSVSYKWFANDSQNEWTSQSGTYTVNKGTPTLNLTLEGYAGDVVVTYSTTTNATGWEENGGDSDATYQLWRNTSTSSVLVGSGSSVEDIQILAEDTWYYRYNTSGGDNWTANSLTRTLTVVHPEYSPGSGTGGAGGTPGGGCRYDFQCPSGYECVDFICERIFPKIFNITVEKVINFSYSPEEFILDWLPGKKKIELTISNHENESIHIMTKATFDQAVISIEPKSEGTIPFDIEMPMPCDNIKKTITIFVKKGETIERHDIPVYILCRGLSATEIEELEKIWGSDLKQKPDFTPYMPFIFMGIAVIGILYFMEKKSFSHGKVK